MSDWKNSTGLILEDVIVSEDGKTAQNPIHPDTAVVALHYACCFVGLPANLLVFFVHLRVKRLIVKPRRLLSLGLTLSNIFAYVPVLIELSYLYKPSESLCRAYVAIVGLPYVVFLANMLLALSDRYLTMAHPFRHRRRATFGLILVCQLLVSLSISIVYKFPYIAQILPLHCGIHFIQVRLISVVLFVLFVACVVGQITVYIQLRKHLAFQRNRRETGEPAYSLSLSAVRAARQARRENINGEFHYQSNRDEVTDENIQIELLDQASVASPQQPIDQLQPNASVTESRFLSEIEVEATQNVISGVLALVIVTGPFIAFTSWVFICRLMDSSGCGSILWLAPYLKELPLIHSVYHPLMYMWRNKVSCRISIERDAMMSAKKNRMSR